MKLKCGVAWRGIALGRTSIPPPSPNPSSETTGLPFKVTFNCYSKGREAGHKRIGVRRFGGFGFLADMEDVSLSMDNTLLRKVRGMRCCDTSCESSALSGEHGKYGVRDVLCDP